MLRLINYSKYILLLKLYSSLIYRLNHPVVPIYRAWTKWYWRKLL